MQSISLQDIKKRGSKVLKDKTGATYIIVNSKVIGVYLPLEEYESIEEMLEELEDIRIYEERKDEPTISYEEFFKGELGS